MKKYVAYFRVSTQRQSNSGLGIAAQHTAVENFMKSNPGTIIAEFTETESGKNNNRVELANAIRKCREEKAVLLIAKLDRLSRNAALILHLRDSGIEIQACDIPTLSFLHLGILATIAQHEAELISSRTKAALAEKKEKLKAEGKKLGTPENLINNRDKAEERSRETRKTKALSNPHNIMAARRIKELLEMGKTWGEVIKELKANNYQTSSGGNEWRIIQAQRLHKLFNQK